MIPFLASTETPAAAPEFYARTEFYTVVVYLLLMIGIGVYFVRRNRGGLDYFACGRRVPWWVSGISLYMGNFSAWLFTGGAGMIYKTTWYGLIYFLLTGAVAYFLGSQLTAAQWRRSRRPASTARGARCLSGRRPRAPSRRSRRRRS